MIRLDLGGGQHKTDGYVNLDKSESLAPDVVRDLDRFRRGGLSQADLAFAATRYLDVISDIRIRMSVRKP